ncbi:MAG: hypothetical protein HKN82_09855 [Akkermansiaceae bacterium]|nr:hypothetical protein [Akkermansiaceae bacterium]NNM28708.1 hypothetical protein [Akkermansiaceae bacterium]
MKSLDPFSQEEPFSEPLSPLPSTPEAEPSPKGKDGDAQVQLTATAPAEAKGDGDAKLEIQQPKARRGWKLWRRGPSPREQQLAVLQQGCSEMVGLMRSIRDHLHHEHSEREGTKKSLSPLPLAMESLNTMKESQAQTGVMLGELTTHVARSRKNDEMLLSSFERFNTTMGGAAETFGSMDRTLKTFEKTNHRSLQTMQALGQRVEESDRFLGETFARLRDSEREFSERLGKSAKRSALATVSMCALLSVTVAILAVAFHEGNAQLAQIDSQSMRGWIARTPQFQDGRDTAVALEDLGRDDGIDEPDREIVRDLGPVTVPDLGPVEGPLDFNQSPVQYPFGLETPAGGLLSITSPPKR